MFNIIYVYPMYCPKSILYCIFSDFDHLDPKGTSVL